jgi:pimeloyl-ACP methyl ester carboxylesterase
MQLEVITHQPEGRAHPTPLLFVHGAWHGAWCWENFLPYFAQQGYECHALSLRGHGESEGRSGIRGYSAAHDYVADVAQVIQTLRTPPILIGHSMGGYVVQKYLETQSVPAGILLASLPVSGLMGFNRRYLAQHPVPFLKSLFRLDPGQLIATIELAKQAFFSPTLPDREVARHFARLQPESWRVSLEATVLNLPQPQKVKTPLLVLAAANDPIFSIGETQATARAYHTVAEVFPNMAHDMMLEPDWQKVADRMISWLTQFG